MKEFWVKVGEKVMGPFDSKKLAKLASLGKLKAMHLVSSDKEHWVPATKVKGLKFPGPAASPQTKSEPEEETYGFMDVKLPESPKQSRGVPPPKMPVTKKSKPKAPEISEDDDSYIEVLTSTGKAKQMDIRKIRQQLMSGKLTRHNEARWIEPKPKRSEYFAEEGTSNEECQAAYDEAMAEWNKRRKWRPIGKGLAEDVIRIKLLYDPPGTFAEMGFMTTAVLAVVVLWVGGFFAAHEIGLLDDGPLNPIKAVQLRWIVAPVLIVLTIPFAAVIGFIVGGPTGWLLGTCLAPLFPSPPDDGYTPKETA